MWENVVFLVIFDTCDIMYNWSISLLPLSILNNLFVFKGTLRGPLFWKSQIHNAFTLYMIKNVKDIDIF